MVVKLVLEIDSANEAMSTAQHVADALISVGGRVRELDFKRNDSKNGRILDTNGNTVGFWVYTEVKEVLDDYPG